MNIQFQIASVDTLLITFCNEISKKCSQRVQKAFYLLKQELDAKEIIPSYSSLAVTFDILHYSVEQIQEQIKTILLHIDTITLHKSAQTIEIPALYDISVGIDLERIASLHSLDISSVIKIHASKEYFVYTIGFLPGFAYMGDVDSKIATPRLKSPRANVAKGSIAIANKQCAIYPQNSPGGWNIIAKTPLELVSKSYNNFSLLQIGYKVRFIPISKKEFLDLGGTL